MTKKCKTYRYVTTPFKARLFGNMLETSKMLQRKPSHQKACAHRAKKTDWINPWNRSISCLLLKFFLLIIFAYSQIFEISLVKLITIQLLQTSRASEQDLFIEVGRSDRLIIFPLEEVAKLLHCSCPGDGGLAFTANCLKNELFESPDTAWIEHIQETASQKIRGRILSAAFCCHLLLLLVSRSSPEQSFSMLFRSCSNWRRQAIFCAALWRSSPHDKFETFSDYWKNWSW